MAEAVLASSTSAHLEPFLLLSKNAKGAACVQLIQDALSAPGVYVFSELLEMPTVQELSQNPEQEPYVNLLRLFAYGTYQDYRANAASLPPLNDAQLKKLKHLSIVTLSGDNRTLNYDLLLQYLDIPNVRELEDLIIDAIYQDLIRGKLDQQKKCLDVEYAMGRDLRPGQADRILVVLGAWARTSETILTNIDEKIGHITQWNAMHAREQEEYEKLIEQTKKEVREKGAEKHNRPAPPDFSDFGEYAEEGGRKAGKRSSKGRYGGPSRR
ncbi:uncharacterized protein SPPG_02310 [Spizellomyces punctatus DAOM BR117]|uniref:PCI domain-containing protein n=1 Tax=Spizellomyces punctatus (strain DAOM BR117) TaxID=645134 RepID=A0A0L0HQC3_SPIPD|nr:uncharacterized protein SPPG_02310 [Spizellomyces punctatus DAOM BR117]KND03258.1 hypothetical protein SPPG_02310 [Spizellomyces punctatus DAOM BR117]|eukprot:XP_016611297.1 hypothetical protein SPPG_02310 [Spizellomyces punctatus DAOM BR117]